MVDNGKFVPYLIKEINRAEDLFERAKVYDSNLGETAKLDKVVLDKYLEAVFVFDDLKVELINKATAIDDAKYNYESIHDKASKGSTWHHYIIHFTFYVFWTIFVFVISVVWSEKLEPIYQDVVTSISNFGESDPSGKVDLNHEGVAKGKER